MMTYFEIQQERREREQRIAALREFYAREFERDERHRRVMGILAASAFLLAAVLVVGYLVHVLGA